MYMAHAATVNALVDELVMLITLPGPANDKAFRNCKARTGRVLRSHQYPRTNPFQVNRAFNGLVEKFEILNNDRIALALQSCLNRLSGSLYSHDHEALSLLLHLSNKPGEDHTPPRDDERASDVLEQQLTWDAIVVDDPLEEDGIWEDVNFTADSPPYSEDEVNSTSNHQDSEVESIAFDAAGQEDASPLEGACLSPVDLALIKKYANPVRPCSMALKIDDTRPPASLLIKDVMSTLQGHPSRSFRLDDNIFYSTPVRYSTQMNTSATSLEAVLSSFAKISSDVHSLRLFSGRHHNSRILQRFAVAVQERVKKFDDAVAVKAQQFARPDRPIVSSLLDLHNDVVMYSSSLRRLRNFAVDGEQLKDEESYRLLDALWQSVSAAESIGDSDAFIDLCDVFYLCLLTYLNPVRQWLFYGILQTENSLSFVSTTGSTADRSEFWDSHYRLEMSVESLNAPTFLVPLVKDIFASGKTLAFLNELEDARPNSSNWPDVAKEFDDLAPTQLRYATGPFTNTSNDVLRRWVRKAQNRIAPLLQTCIMDRCRLFECHEALEIIYLSKDGTLFRLFADRLYQLLLKKADALENTLLLEDLARTTFSASENIDSHCITVQWIGHANAIEPKPTRLLGNLRINYQQTWTIANILQPQTIVVYQETFTLLLQIRCAKHRITSRPLRPKGNLPSNTMLAIFCGIRHRLLWFVSALESHIICHVIWPACQDLRKALADAKDIDEMISAHKQFTTLLSRRCLQDGTTRKELSSILSLLELSVVFKDAVEPELFDSAPNSGELSVSLTQLAQLREQFSKILALLVTGLRTASRHRNGDETWELLADVLAVGLESERQ